MVKFRTFHDRAGVEARGEDGGAGGRWIVVGRDADRVRLSGEEGRVELDLPRGFHGRPLEVGDVLRVVASVDRVDGLGRGHGESFAPGRLDG